MNRDLVVVFIVGLGVGKLTQMVKEATWAHAAWFKSLLAVGMSAGFAVLLVTGWKDMVLVALGASGIASLSHALDSALRGFRDNQRSDVVLKSRSRTRM